MTRLGQKRTKSRETLPNQASARWICPNPSTFRLPSTTAPFGDNTHFPVGTYYDCELEQSSFLFFENRCLYFRYCVFCLGISTSQRSEQSPLERTGTARTKIQDRLTPQINITTHNYHDYHHHTHTPGFRRIHICDIVNFQTAHRQDT